MKRNLVVSLIVVASVLCCAGCRPRRAVERHPPYAGPTEPMNDVVAAINANNSAVPTLWARHQFEARIYDERGRETFANGDGSLVYKSPRGMRLVGNKDIAGPVFEIASSDDRYWLMLSPPGERSRMLWGWYRNLGRPCVDTRNLPVRPDLVLQVLGVGTIDTNFLEPPVPTMRFNNYAFNGTGAYMFVWNAPATKRDRWWAQKEIWYDRETKLPRAVLLYDENGRVVLEAKLSGHAPLEVEGAAEQTWPKVARRYELFFPDTRSTMRFDLEEVALDRDGVMRKRGIVFPNDPKVDEVIQLDEDCID